MPKITEVIGLCNTLLVDPLWLRWPQPELLDYYNNAVRATIIVLPYAGATVEVIDCVPGTRQSLPSGAIRLLDVTRVVGGRAVRPVPREVLDSQYPDWHSMTGTVERYCYDESIPKTYHVFPGALSGVQLEAEVARIPAPAGMSDLESDIPLDELYVNPIVEFMLYRAYSKDAESAANSSLAATHYQNWSDLLGVKTQAEQTQGKKKQAQYNGGTQS